MSNLGIIEYINTTLSLYGNADKSKLDGIKSIFSSWCKIVSSIFNCLLLIEFSIKYKVSLDYLLCLSKNNQHQSKFKDFEDN